MIALASRNAVHGFLERMTTLYGGIDKASRVLAESRVKFASVPAGSALLRDKLGNLADRIMPITSDDGASDVSEAVLSCTSSGAAVLCVAPAFEDFDEPQALTQALNKLAFAGMDVTRAPGYRVKAGDHLALKQELDWLRGSAPLPSSSLCLRPPSASFLPLPPSSLCLRPPSACVPPLLWRSLPALTCLHFAL